MKILGNSFQETEPTPDKPTEIKNENYIFVNINGQPIKYKSNLNSMVEEFIKEMRGEIEL
jgi:hypothetical protein